MQDIYAFDVGDYGKLGLLRHVMAQELSLGVVWWKTQLGSPGLDGKHLAYLRDRTYRQCDPELWDAMCACVSKGPRSIEALESLFPEGTTFFADVIPADANRRLLWSDKSMASARDKDVVFCDPDNGIAFTETSRSQRHVSLSELQKFYSDGHSLVVYHHLNRSCSHAEQIEAGSRVLMESVTDGTPVWSAHFRRGTSRVYFVMPQAKHIDAMKRALQQLSISRWCDHGHFNVASKF